MRGYDHRSYGDGFADVYDDWYGTVTDADATVARMVAVAGVGGRVVELGVGTGRLAVPLARAGLVVVGVDSSDAMLARLRERECGDQVATVCGDMVDDLPDGPFDAALVAYNTIFNLLDEERQRRCFAAVADRLRVGGSFVVEAFVPGAELLDADPAAGLSSDVGVRSLAVDQVVLSVSVDDPARQRIDGHFVQLTEHGGVRLRPWSIRWATPRQLDEMAAAAGLALTDRWADMSGTPFTGECTHHVSVYRKDLP